MRFLLDNLQPWLQQELARQETQYIAEQFLRMGLEVEAQEGHVFELAIPANRGDCLSFRGLARELALATGWGFKAMAGQAAKPVAKTTALAWQCAVTTNAEAACPRYLLRAFAELDASRPTPAWIREALEVAGINSLNILVDLGNYVMLELGQPLHVFAADSIHGQQLKVRYAHAGEQMTTLQQQVLTLQPQDLVISDSKQVLALAGIMGAASAAVSSKTSSILLECAYFQAEGIRASARQHNLQTDSAYRFARQVAPDLQVHAMERFSQLLLEHASHSKAAPQVSSVAIIEHFQHLPKPQTITLEYAQINKALGLPLEPSQVEQCFSRLGGQCHYIEAQQAWRLEVPVHRQDLREAADLIEELVKFVGLAAIPSVMPSFATAFKARKEAIAGKGHFRLSLIERGYTEVITYSFLEAALAKQFQLEHAPLALINPLSQELGVMRPSLLPSLLKVIVYNQHRQQQRVKIFEMGTRFLTESSGASKSTQQISSLAGAVWGDCYPRHWGWPSRAVDFFDIKADVEQQLHLCCLPQLQFVAEPHPWLLAGESALVYQDKRCLGLLGCLAPAIARSMGLEGKVYVFELDLAAMASGGVLAEGKAIAKFPCIRRDLNLVFDQEITAATLLQLIHAEAGQYLTQANIVDVYQGHHIAAGKKSVTVTLNWQHPEATLTEAVVETSIAKIIHAVKQELGAVLREV